MKNRLLKMIFGLIIITALFGTYTYVCRAAVEQSKADRKEAKGSLQMSEYEQDKWATEIVETAMETPALDSELELPLSGKVILAYYDGKSCSVNGKSGFMGKIDPHPDAPYYQPVVSNGEPKFKDIPESVWADTADTCDYLIVYGGFETGRNSNFYEGGADRVTVRTVVYIINPEKKIILHEEVIGVDTPGIITNNPKGRVMFDEAGDYITSILTEK